MRHILFSLLCSIMSQASEVKSLRYSLRPKAGAFDLCMNQNRYGLIRTTVDRKVATTKRNRSPSPLPNIYKRKIRYEVIEDISDARRICKASIQCNGATLTIPKMWQLPERTLAQVTSKPPSTFYDVSKGNNQSKQRNNISFSVGVKMLICYVRFSLISFGAHAKKRLIS